MTEESTELGTMSVQDGFEDLDADELQKIVDDFSIQLKAAKQALRDKRFAGVTAAVEARREADAELADELKKLGYPTAAAASLNRFVLPSAAMEKAMLSTTLRNLYRISNVKM